MTLITVKTATDLFLLKKHSWDLYIIVDSSPSLSPLARRKSYTLCTAKEFDFSTAEKFRFAVFWGGFKYIACPPVPVARAKRMLTKNGYRFCSQCAKRLVFGADWLCQNCNDLLPF